MPAILNRQKARERREVEEARKGNTMGNHALDLSDKIKRHYEKFHVYLEMDNYEESEFCYTFEFKVKKGTNVDDIIKRSDSIRYSLRISRFNVQKMEKTIQITASKKKLPNRDFRSIFRELLNEIKKCYIPYVVGYDEFGKACLVDISKLPHLLIGGTTSSGKSTAIRIIILSTALLKSVSKVNFLLINTETSDFNVFNDLPHLSFPIITNYHTGLKALLELKLEVKRRNDLKLKNNEEFDSLPFVVCIIDEYLAFISNIGYGENGSYDRKKEELLKTTISYLLRIGRHAKIHIILSSQDATKGSMKCDTGNIHARIAFRCATNHNSRAILGEGGAEKLVSNGDLLFRSNCQIGIKNLKGSFVSEIETKSIVDDLSHKYKNYQPKFKIRFSDVPLNSAENRKSTIAFTASIPYCETNEKNELSEVTLVKKSISNDDVLLAKIIEKSIELSDISCNYIQKSFKVGFNKAKIFMEKLFEFGLVSQSHEKTPRRVLYHNLEDLPNETIVFLRESGYESENLLKLFAAIDSIENKKSSAKRAKKIPSPNINMSNRMDYIRSHNSYNPTYRITKPKFESSKRR
jgi:S-DNA-T family DNA segregation ATPase FtsK/SpoIIIE